MANSIINGQSVRIRGRLLNKQATTPVPGGVVYLNPGIQISLNGTTGEYAFITAKDKKYSIRAIFYKPSNLSHGGYRLNTYA